MKYMLMIYANPASPAGADAMAEAGAIMEELGESGELVGGLALEGPAAARTVKVRDGVPAVTDGPFIEAKEYLAGYLVVECDGIERATEIAARWPDAKLCAMEVWPVINEVTG